MKEVFMQLSRYLLAVLAVASISIGAAASEPDGALSLDDSVMRALEANPDISIAVERVAASEAVVREVRGGFLPNAFAEAAYQRIDKASTISMEGGPFDLPEGLDSFNISPTESYRAGFRAEQTLFAGGRIFNSYRAAQSGSAVAIHNLEAVRNLLAFHVKEAYYTALVTRRLRQVAEQASVRLDAHLQDVTRYLEVGVVARVDLLRTEVEKADADRQVNLTRNAVDLAEAGFNNLLNRSLDMPVALEDVLTYTPTTTTIEDATARALEERPELAAVAAQAVAAERNLAAVKGEYLPTVAATGTYGWHKGTELEIQDEDWHWTVGFSGQLTLWDGAAREARVAKANADQRRAASELEKARDGVVLEVRQAYLSMRDAEKNIAVAQKALASAEESYRISKLRYETGAGTNTEVLDAQTALAEAQGNHYQALYGYRVAVARLQYATGSR